MLTDLMLPLTWAGIFLCLSQSAIFSGLNLALFSIARLNLELEAKAGSEAAKRVLELRRDSNMALATILWGNVAINVLLTILADSVLAGAMAFLFSTVMITIFGEIIPQA
ncbi:MAG: CNNM domain-containing protein, partial [Candidatus Binatia bacterium]